MADNGFLKEDTADEIPDVVSTISPHIGHRIATFGILSLRIGSILPLQYPNSTAKFASASRVSPVFLP
jgi:hypothetical protein